MLGLLISDLSVVLCVLVMLHLDPDFGPDFHVTVYCCTEPFLKCIGRMKLFKGLRALFLNGIP